MSRPVASLSGKEIILALAGVLALMWPALVNRQPFFFPDTTAYVRAADLAAQIASGGRFTTAWSRPRGGTPAASGRDAGAAQAAVPRGSDGSGGKVMSGRSPYLGALLYLGYVTSGFWLFVVGQALVAWWLIGLALRCFGLDRPEVRAGVTLVLALGTPLAYYDGLLLADALAGFGLLAFFLLASPRAPLSPAEKVGLVLVALASVTVHLTHIVMYAAMTGMLLLLVLVRQLDWRDGRWPVALGASAVLVGLLSVMLTSRVVTAALGRPPALVPLMTARFVADGPGRDFIAGGCGGDPDRFAVCRIRYSGPNAQAWLWDKTAPTGVFLPASPAVRDRLSAEDTAFALAVLKAYPLRQGGMMLLNTVRQLVAIDSGAMNEPCLADPACSADALPPNVRATLRASPSGQSRWPVAFIAAKDQLVAVAGLLAIVALLPVLGRREPEMARRYRLWLLLLAAAMLVNAFFGGAISEPQGRYQGRIIWLVPLLALVAGLRWRLLARPAAARVPLSAAAVRS